MDGVSIHSTSGHIAAVLIFVPMEWLRLDFVISPGVNGFQGGLTPVKVFVFSEISRAVDKEDELFTFRLYEPFPYSIPDELAKRVVI